MRRLKLLSVIMAVLMLVSAVPAESFAAGEVHNIAVASDRHGNATAIKEAMSGMPKSVEYVSIIGDLVGESGDRTPEYKTSTVVKEIKSLKFKKAKTVKKMSILWADHDKNVDDDKSIVFGEGGYDSGVMYTGKNSDGSVAYYIYGIGYYQMKEEEAGAEGAKAFETWIDTIEDKTIPIIVFCHVPLHYARKDNKGAEAWTKALNYAATGSETTDDGASVTRDVLYFYGHNHTTETKGDYSGEFYVPVGARMEVGATEDVWSTVYFTYVTAGYLNSNTSATLISIKDSQIKIVKYQNGKVNGSIYDTESKKSGAFATKFGTKGRKIIKRVTTTSMVTTENATASALAA